MRREVIPMTVKRLFNGLWECECGERYDLQDATEDQLTCEVYGEDLEPVEDDVEEEESDED